MSRQQFQATTDAAVLRDRLRRIFRVDLIKPATTETLFKKGKDAPILAVYSGPPEAAEHLLKTSRPIAMVPAYRHTEPVALAAASERSFHTYNLSEGVLQVHDILRAIESAPGTATVEIVPIGDDMIVPSLYAAALSSRPARLSASNIAKAQSAPAATFFVPGLERVGGMDAALRLLKAAGQSAP
jgi:hypothetical protein